MFPFTQNSIKISLNSAFLVLTGSLRNGPPVPHRASVPPASVYTEQAFTWLPGPSPGSPRLRVSLEFPREPEPALPQCPLWGEVVGRGTGVQPRGRILVTYLGGGLRLVPEETPREGTRHPPQEDPRPRLEAERRKECSRGDVVRLGKWPRLRPSSLLTGNHVRIDFLLT